MSSPVDLIHSKFAHCDSIEKDFQTHASVGYQIHTTHHAHSIQERFLTFSGDGIGYPFLQVHSVISHNHFIF